MLRPWPPSAFGIASAWMPSSRASRRCRSRTASGKTPPFNSASTSCGISSSSTKRRTFACQARAVAGRGCGIGSGGRGRRRLAAELAWKELFHIGAADAPRLLAFDALGIEQDFLPQAVDHGVEAVRDLAGVEMAVAAGIDDLLNEAARLPLVRLSPAGTEPQEVGAPARLAPEGVPDRHHLASTGCRIEIDGDHGVDLGGGARAGATQGRRQEGLVLFDQMSQRGGQQRLLGLEVAADDALRQIGLARNIRQCRAAEAALGNRFNRRRDQLFATGVLAIPTCHAACPRGSGGAADILGTPVAIIAVPQ